MNKFTEIICWGAVGTIALIFLPQVGGPWVRILAWILVVGSLLLICGPSSKDDELPRPSRWRAAGVFLIATSLLSINSNNREAAIETELNALRMENEDQYLERLRELRGDRHWEAELKQLRPEEYTSMMAQREITELKAVQTREACAAVRFWLETEGLRQYRQASGSGVEVFSVETNPQKCSVDLSDPVFAKVNLGGLTVALNDRPNPRDLEADAIVSLDDYEVCSVAWALFDWKETNRC